MIPVILLYYSVDCMTFHKVLVDHNPMPLLQLQCFNVRHPHQHYITLKYITLHSVGPRDG